MVIPLVAFPSKERKAYSGLALVIVSGKKGSPGKITVTAKSAGLDSGLLVIRSQ